MAHAFLLAQEFGTTVQICRKVPQPSRQVAQQIVRRQRMAKDQAGLKAVGVGKFGAYKCTICRQWHVGHKG